MRLLLALLMGISLGGHVSAQSVSLSVSEAQAKLDELRKAGPSCGVVIPLGEYNFVALEVGEGMPRHEQWLAISALKDVGVVNIVDLPTMIGSVHFRVEVRPDLDPANVM